MANKLHRITVGEESLPSSLQTDILPRFMNQRELINFWENYKRCKMRLRPDISVAPTEQEYLIANDKKSGATFSQLREKYGISNSNITNAIRKVSIWEYMHA